ncbi:hypothetical protein L861_06960 [Litchfieldella anticariensis FP35 = DSM 16096]|uniref:DUF4123 domain-containing protein n=1 Tax=Litchfieldella anticariensis (strain DSM 16096 / CECT 5854 / CIP 108499 / LMG 22089 / FP35) TaxID=1121939 RepID=S2KDE8_LITA3|nr:DUF4123 domain-containing protein [Halomonas anticariensis]EPC00227.1 hypothetical protein L861_06960 [Halomonas anticariensis FP35 = DSM 16096]
MKVISAESLSALLGTETGLKHWLVLEETGQTLASLYDMSPAVEYEWLFLETPFADFLKRSPLILRLNDVRGDILHAFEQDPKTGISPGIVVSSQASEAEVFAHLRRCLEVRFYDDRKGMLRYYHPDIAAALFESSSRPSRQWLGPLECWIWFGTTLQQQHNEGPCWHALCHDESDVEALELNATQPIALSREQEDALEAHILARRAWRAYRRPEESLDDGDTRYRFIEHYRAAQQLEIPADQYREFFELIRRLADSEIHDILINVPVSRRLDVLREHIDHAREGDVV